MKRFVLATSMMILLAISGQAYAGTTISDQRYWPGELSWAHQNESQHPVNASVPVESPQGIRASGESYHGGPKGDD